MDSISQSKIRIVQFSKAHLFAWFFLAIFLLIFWKNAIHFIYIVGEPYNYIPNNKVKEHFVHQINRNLRKAVYSKSKCEYDQIISNNEYVFNETYLKDLIDPSSILPGGEFIPSDCKPEFSTAILIPYRDRPEQLNEFLIYIHNFLRQQYIHYRIFVAEQVDKKPFNRAKLLNIGAKYAKEAGFPCLILHDVDLFPMNLGNLYVCTKYPRHFAVNIDKRRFHLFYGGYFGGVTSIQTEAFKKVNGMSNLYYGWGSEDDDFLGRVYKSNLRPIRFGPDYSMYSMVKHKQEKKNEKRFEIMRHIQKRYKSDGLNSLNFTLKHFERLPYFTHIAAEL